MVLTEQCGETSPVSACALSVSLDKERLSVPSACSLAPFMAATTTTKKQRDKDILLNYVAIFSLIDPPPPHPKMKPLAGGMSHK